MTVKETATTSAEPPAPDRPWLAWYDPGVPHDVVVPDQPLDRLLSDAAAKYPDRTAIRFYGRDISYAALETAVNRFANMLVQLGVEKGDRIALMLPNCPQMVIAYYGTLRAGAVVAPISPLYVEAEIQHQLADAGARVMLVLSALYPRVQAIRKSVPELERVLVTNIKEYFPPLVRALFTLAREKRDGHRVTLPDDGRTEWLQPLMARASEARLSSNVRGEDLALLQYTGGTTGLAKAAMLRHSNLVANTLQTRAWFSNVGRPDGSDVILGVIPLFHIYAMTTVMNFGIAGGSTLVLLPKFDLKEVLKTIGKEKPTIFPGVPTMYMAINSSPELTKYDLTSVKGAISGAAPLPQQVQSEFESLTGAKLVEGYGLTEASPVTHCNPLEGQRKVGTIGVPFPSTDAAIFDQESGTRRLPAGEVGELAVRGPQVMQGYWRRENESAQVLRDGWLFTGDIARMDEQGYFTIVDRKKDMILTGGMNVYPRDVEEPLYQHPKVKEAVAIGIPDQRWGEAVKVYIVLKGGQTATEQEMIDYCREKMARYKVPKYVEFRSELPKTMVGKFLRRKLLEEEKARQAASS